MSKKLKNEKTKKKNRNMKLKRNKKFLMFSKSTRIFLLSINDRFQNENALSYFIRLTTLLHHKPTYCRIVTVL